MSLVPVGAYGIDDASSFGFGYAAPAFAPAYTVPAAGYVPRAYAPVAAPYAGSYGPVAAAAPAVGYVAPFGRYPGVHAPAPYAPARTTGRWRGSHPPGTRRPVARVVPVHQYRQPVGYAAVPSASGYGYSAFPNFR
eukprot:TRINITY_DN758_c0_g1_i2.p2 TRINITY_DN758_c0_g1~~TRINITY_DN758_c0_g1_i2.p2  ORF type:complete len:136 (-),score=20.49 TRINITY_DN758_c0_g1_i2:10-417(-)